MNDDRSKPLDPAEGEPAGDDQVVAERVVPSEPPRAPEPESVRETLYKQPGTREQVPATEARNAALKSINATTVIMERSGAEEITAERVTMDRSGAKSLETKSAQLDRSGVMALSSDHTVLHRSSAIQVVAEEARVKDSPVVFLMAERASIEGSRIIVFAGSAEGDVQAVITARAAVVLGGIIAAALAVFGLLLRERSDG